jgi:hypothetical protein
MSRVSTELLDAKLRISELSRENDALRQTVHDLNESLKESTRLMLKTTPRPNRPTLSADQRMMIAGRARFKCANPFDDCHLYKLPPYDGSFTEAGYEIDHVVPFHQTYRSTGQNVLQVLCHQCHAKKTRLDRIAAQETSAHEAEAE